LLRSLAHVVVCGVLLLLFFLFFFCSFFFLSSVLPFFFFLSSSSFLLLPFFSFFFLSSPLNSLPLALLPSCPLALLPDPDYNGPDNVTVHCDDLGNSGAIGGARNDSQTIPVDVRSINDAPLWNTHDVLGVSGELGSRRPPPTTTTTTTTNLMVDEDVALDVRGVSVSDVDAGDGEMEVELACGAGLLSIGEGEARALTFPGKWVKVGESG
jgi:hypothetical protein